MRKGKTLMDFFVFFEFSPVSAHKYPATRVNIAKKNRKDSWSNRFFFILPFMRVLKNIGIG